MRFLHDHDEVSYQGRAGAYWVRYRGKIMGRVKRSEHARGWVYSAVHYGITTWTELFETRKDAADNLISYNYPSAAWLM